MITGLRSLDCIAFGVPFRLTAESDVLLARMQRHLPLTTQIRGPLTNDVAHFAVMSEAENTRSSLLLDDVRIAESTSLEQLLSQLATKLMIHVANHAADRVFLHAGVVGWKGSTLLLPGTSFAGKTTLVTELVRTGATYYSDEYAVLDPQGLVHPYARDLQVRRIGEPNQRSVSVGQLNGSAGTAPLPISHIVFTEYVAGSTWNPQPVSPGLAVLEMMRHAIPVQRTPARVMATLAKVMETATALRTERGEASEAARLLLAAIKHA